ncbi:MAG TPA: NADH:flavin oxidoreductase [Anaeromyxobacteraceae bacterium]|nr:NADH:flavin oxidoreductase [Anaeromyxobacteraceae bacterium]
MPHISDPLQLKGLHLANRLVMAPMVTGLAVADAPSDAQVAWYAKRARSGVGLLIVEATAVLPDAKPLPFMLGLWNDAQVAGLSRLASAIKAAGIPAVLQIVHGGARAWRDDLARERIGPSAVPLMPGPPPRAMTEAEIEETIGAFAAAASRAKAAGFDGVEIHAAHYFLLSQFLSPYVNRRSDRWGGDRRGRGRLAAEVTRAIRRAAGPDYPVFCRMHAVELVNGGMGTEDAACFARAFEEAGADLIDASAIGQSSLAEREGRRYLTTTSVSPKGAPAGEFAPFAGRLKAEVGIPVITVGKLWESTAAQQVLDRRQADLVALARQLIADPTAAHKLLAGRDAEIQRCKECSTCFAAIRKGPVKCSVNRDC